VRLTFQGLWVNRYDQNSILRQTKSLIDP